MKGVEAVVMGASAGGVQALLEILPYLPADYPVPVMTVLHIPADRANALVPLLRSKCEIGVKEAEDKESLAPGTVYFAPADYHLLVETDGSLALSSDEPVNFSRPSIDVLFESAADAYGAGLTGVILTGANEDGAAGLSAVTAAGGVALVEEPAAAYAQAMPQAARNACDAALALPLEGIAEHLKGLGTE
mgnify:CR=1 FL=1